MKSTRFRNPLSFRKPGAAWTPSSLEAKCLSHLDQENNWSQILGRERPGEMEPQSWRPFFKIFYINLAVFWVTTMLAFFSVEIGGGSSRADLLSDLVPGAALMLTLSTVLASYVTYLYRRSWNRRASALIEMESDVTMQA